MPNVYIVMGGDKTGKSTIIRALTGYKGRIKGKLDLTNEQTIDIFICENSLQEKGITVDDLLKESDGCENILVAMHINGRVRGSAYTLIGNLLKQKCTISQIVSLSEKNDWKEIKERLHSIQQLPEPAFFVPFSQSANAIAAEIRGQWGWL